MTDAKIPTIRESKKRLRKAGFGAFAEISERKPVAERGLWPSRWLVKVTAYAGVLSKLQREVWGEREWAARRLAYYWAAEAAERRGR